MTVKAAVNTPVAERQRLARFALASLKEARDYLKRAHAPQAADAVRRAMKSTEGALRHLDCIETRMIVGQQRAYEAGYAHASGYPE